jgi:hypothetical protein
MVLAKGSKVLIAGLKFGGGDYTGALAEDFTVSLTSEFRRLADDFQNEATQAIDVAGQPQNLLVKEKLGLALNTNSSVLKYGIVLNQPM